MVANWVSQIIVVNDIAKRAPPALQTSIDKIAMAWDIVSSVFAVRVIELFCVASVQDEVEVSQGHTLECFPCSCGDELVETIGVLSAWHPSFEECNTSWRELVGNADGRCVVHRLDVDSWEVVRFSRQAAQR